MAARHAAEPFDAGGETPRKVALSVDTAGEGEAFLSV